jgi:hypothetical protein
MITVSTEKIEFDRWFTDKKQQVDALVGHYYQLEEVDAPRKVHVVIGKVNLGGMKSFEVKKHRGQWKVYKSVVRTGCDNVFNGLSLDQQYMFGYAQNMPVMELRDRDGEERESTSWEDLFTTVNRVEGKLGVAKVILLLKNLGAEQILGENAQMIGKVVS